MVRSKNANIHLVLKVRRGLKETELMSSVDPFMDFRGRLAALSLKVTQDLDSHSFCRSCKIELG